MKKEMKRQIKRGALLTLALFLLATLAFTAGCAEKEPTAPENAFIIAVDIGTEEKVYTLCLEAKNEAGETYSGGWLMNADGTRMKGTEYFTFVEGDLPGTSPFAGLSFRVGVYLDKEKLADGEEIPTNFTEPFSPAFGNLYHFTLTGDKAAGFVLTPKQ